MGLQTGSGDPGWPCGGAGEATAHSACIPYAHQFKAQVLTSKLY